MLSSLKRSVGRHFRNYSGWTTKRRIVVIESDDWGSIRMPSQKVYYKFKKRGIPVDKSPYCRYDTLASREDLQALFDMLSGFRDSRDNPPVITANALMANPDFDKIEASGFRDYYFEKFTETLLRYPGCQNSFKLWKEGLDSGLFYPQFHGREHVNVPLWLKLLRGDHELLKFAFRHRFWGLSNGILKDLNGSIQSPYDGASQEALEFQKRSISEGLNLFKEILGYSSKSFIAGNYIWSPDLEKTLFDQGVRYIQGMKYQLLPGNGERKSNPNKIRHYVGERNRLGQIYLLRNCVFEPSLYEGKINSVQQCLKDISNAFFWDKPAIITMHRLNVIGSLMQENRSRNLALLSKLLSKILKKWPEVEFMNSVQLGKVIEDEKLIEKCD